MLNIPELDEGGAGLTAHEQKGNILINEYSCTLAHTYTNKLTGFLVAHAPANVTRRLPTLEELQADLAAHGSVPSPSMEASHLRS